MLKNYKYLIFSMVLGATSFLGAFTIAQNADKLVDSDNDGLNDYQEKDIYHTDPNNPDTDQDAYTDGNEVKNRYSPRQPKLKIFQADSDNDGLNDLWEVMLGANLLDEDSDDDGMKDGEELLNNFSPTDPKPIKYDKRIEVSTKTLRLKFIFNNILVDNVPVSTGKKSTPTPLGEFSIIAKYPIKNYNRLPNTKWNMHFATVKGLRYYIHGAYWHNQFGVGTVSGGCVNLRYEDMERIYNFTPVGTKVIVE